MKLSLILICFPHGMKIIGNFSSLFFHWQFPTQTMCALDAGAADACGWKKHIFLATAVVLICKVLFMSQWQFWRISVLTPWGVLGTACSCRAGSAGEGISLAYYHVPAALCSTNTLKTPRHAEDEGFALLYRVSSLKDMEAALLPLTQTPETAKIR